MAEGVSDTGRAGPAMPRMGRLAARLATLRARLGELWWWTLLLFVAQRLGDLANLAVGLFIVPKFVPAEELGAVLPLMSIAGFVAFPLAIVLMPVEKFLNVFAGRGEYGKVKSLLRDSALVSLFFAALAGAWLFWRGDAILLRMHVADRRIFIPIAGFAIFSCIEPLVQSSLKALKCFGTIVATGLAIPFVRLGAMLLLLPALGAFGYLMAQFSSSAAGLAIGAVAIFAVLRSAGKGTPWLPHWREMARYAAPLLAITLAGRVQGPVETFVIRHRLPEEVSAGYYFANVFGMIPLYLSTAMATVLFPLASERFERGESTRGILLQSMAFNAAMAAGTLALTAVAAPLVFRIPGPWSRYADYSRFVWQVGLIMSLKGAQGIFMTHENACRSFRYVRYLVPLYLAEAATLYVLPAWDATRPYLPEWLWGLVASSWNLSLQGILALTILFNAIFAAAMALDFFLSNARAGDRRMAKP